MLAVSSYPYYLKTRIRSDRGHLSNTDSAQCIRRLALSGTGRFILGHLSKENNTPDLAGQTVRQVLVESGLEEGRDFLLQVARRLEPSSRFVFEKALFSAAFPQQRHMVMVCSFSIRCN